MRGTIEYSTSNASSNMQWTTMHGCELCDAHLGRLHAIIHHAMDGACDAPHRAIKDGCTMYYKYRKEFAPSEM